MPINDDYLTRLHTFTTKYTKLVLSNFRYYVKIVGTDIVAKRIVAGEFKEALGAAYIFDGTNAGDKFETFQKRIVINRSHMVSDYKTTTEDLEAYTNENFYKIGDQLEFTYNNVFYRYKVTEIEQFDPYSENLYKLTLSGFEEYIKNK